MGELVGSTVECLLEEGAKDGSALERDGNDGND